MTNNKLRNAKSIEENEKLSFSSTIYWTIWCEFLFVSIYIFLRATGKKVTEKSEKMQKSTFQKIRFFSIILLLLSHSNNTVWHH